MSKSAQLTPMLRQYLDVKAQHPDAVVLYRMGDFYEAFFEDAVEIAPILEVALTARNKGKATEAPMCGVPHHALEVYLGKLIRAGRRVAICDQVEDPAEAKGLVRREVTRVVTPGTVTEPQLLEGDEDNLLAGVVWNGESGAGAFLDISTGLFFLRRWRGAEEAAQDLALHRPREILAGEGLPEEVERWVVASGACRSAAGEDVWVDPRRSAEVLERHFGTTTLRGFGLEEREPAVQAAAMTLRYAQETQRSELPHVRSLGLRLPGDTLILDSETLANLEVFRSLREGGRRGTLLSVLDKTVTAAGGRLLKHWLRHPLRAPQAIRERLDAVGSLADNAERRSAIRKALSAVSDIERLVSRAVLGSLGPREAAALRESLLAAPVIAGELAEESGPLAELAGVDPVDDLRQELVRVLQPEPAANLAKGGVIAPGVDEELDRCRSLDRDSKRHVLELERAERERTGISSLKVRFNKVFGYYLEVSKAKLEGVPENYERKQTLVNAERFVTPELKELEQQVLSAEVRLVELETRHFDELRQRIVDAGARLERLAAALAELDALAGFAEVAVLHGYVRPVISEIGSPIKLRDARHPVVERLTSEEFVPNDTELGEGSGEIVVLTGPNMGGKSTYLRQVALVVLMAQAGSFVPAAEADIGVVDRIFTRVGASDDLTRGESTFMVEMVETAKILHQATSDSLVILDEVGRGTATFDGLSLAWSIVESLHENPRPKTLFATHYHELTELAGMLPGVVNRTLAVKEWDDKIVFLRRVIPGSADKSYGLHVARLAGIPPSVIERASQILSNLEAQEYDLSGQPRLAQGDAPASATPNDQLNLFAPPEQVVASVLKQVDLEELSPLAALNLLNALQKRLG